MLPFPSSEGGPTGHSHASSHPPEQVYKLDCGAHKEKCKELGIRMLPTFQTYRNGELLQEMFGTSTDKLTEIINSAVA